MLWIDFLEVAALEAFLLVVGHRAVEDDLAGNAMITNGGRAGWVVRRVERMAPYARYGDDVHVSLEAGVHSPKNVFDIEGINVLVNQEHVFQLAER